MYRNRINTYVKQGLSQKEAEDKAFLDFKAITEETQQSSRPDRISEQQASNAGRLFLAFANTPMQYNRIIKRNAQDLVDGRGDPKEKVTKIIYYRTIQNLLFNGLSLRASCVPILFTVKSFPFMLLSIPNADALELSEKSK